MLDALEDRGIEDAWRFAEPLGVGRARRGLGRPRAGHRRRRRRTKTLAWVAASLTARELATELVESTERMSTLVKAIKTYAYMDRGDVVDRRRARGPGEHADHARPQAQAHAHQGQARLRQDAAEADACTAPSSTRCGRTCSTTRSARSARTGMITITTLADNGCVQGRHRRRRPGHPGRGRASTSSTRSSPPRPRAAARAWGWTPRGASSSSATAARSAFDTGDGGTVFHVWLPVEETTEMTRCSHLDTIEITELPGGGRRLRGLPARPAASGCTCGSA